MVRVFAHIILQWCIYQILLWCMFNNCWELECVNGDTERKETLYGFSRFQETWSWSWSWSWEQFRKNVKTRNDQMELELAINGVSVVPYRIRIKMLHGASQKSNFRIKGPKYKGTIYIKFDINRDIKRVFLMVGQKSE
jgi:hypothetical protein